jgi:hypothetical protein
MWWFVPLGRFASCGNVGKQELQIHMPLHTDAVCGPSNFDCTAGLPGGALLEEGRL